MLLCISLYSLTGPKFTIIIKKLNYFGKIDSFAPHSKKMYFEVIGIVKIFNEIIGHIPTKSLNEEAYSSLEHDEENNERK